MNYMVEQNLLMAISEGLRVQDLYIELLQLFPTILLFFILYNTNNSFLTIILYQIFLIILPILYMKFLVKLPLKKFVINEILINWRKQVIIGILLNFLFFLISSTLLYMLYQINAMYMISFDFFLSSDKQLYISLFFLICVMNPIISELYWRLLPLNTIKKPKKLRICFYYGLFHGFIIYRLKNSLSGLTFGIIFIGIGWLLGYIKEKFGLITAILAHMGLNLSYVLAFILIVTEQRKYL